MSILNGIIHHIFAVIYPIEKAVVQKVEEARDETRAVMSDVEAHVGAAIEEAGNATDKLADVVLSSQPARHLMADVLDARARRHKEETGEDLSDWPNSIVDYLKLVDRPSSVEYRASLAAELGYDGEFTGTSEQNVWLSSELKKRIIVV